MPGRHRSGRNRGAYLRKGLNSGLGALEPALLAIAEVQATLGMTDTALERAAGLYHGSLGRLRTGQGSSYAIYKIVEFLERREVNTHGKA